MAYEPMTPEENQKFNDDHEAPAGQIWVCGACGKTAQNSVTHKGASHGWDVACFLNAVLCYSTGDGSKEHPWVEVVK